MTSMRTTRCLPALPLSIAALAAVLTCTEARAQSEGPAVLAERVQALAIEGGGAADPAALREAAALAERALVLHPDDALLHHYRGYALYRLVSRHECDAAEEVGCVGRLLDRAEESLLASIDLGPRAETYALLASVYGLRIGENPALGAALGDRIDDLQAQARSLDAENPRVWLLRGIGDFFTPEAYGGGISAARAALERAAAAFEGDAPSPPEPRWGRADVHVWLGQVHQAAGETEHAREQYEKALAIDPEYAWVRDRLLPSLDAGGS
jgi:tetratricopeptide (TPR) repeat protein